MNKEDVIKVCCVCQKSEHDGDWDHHQHHKLALILNKLLATHTFCPPCFDVLTLEMNEEK